MCKNTRTVKVQATPRKLKCTFTLLDAIDLWIPIPTDKEVDEFAKELNKKLSKLSIIDCDGLEQV